MISKNRLSGLLVNWKESNNVFEKILSMATDPNVPPPEPVQPIATPPNPGQVQPTPQPM